MENWCDAGEVYTSPSPATWPCDYGCRGGPAVAPGVIGSLPRNGPGAGTRTGRPRGGPGARGRATPTCSRARRGHASRPSRCGTRRHRRARTRSCPALRRAGCRVDLPALERAEVVRLPGGGDGLLGERHAEIEVEVA